MWAMHLPEDSKFQRYFDTKLEKVIGVAYGGATFDTDSNNDRLEEWGILLKEDISYIS